MNAEEVKGSRATVVGGARSGLAVARLLAEQGADVFLTEAGEGSQDLTQALRQATIDFELGGHTDRALQADYLAVSPGVPTSASIVQQALQRGLPVYSEIEVASWFCRAPMVAITGSNGKTTTTSLAGHVFRCAGRATTVAGNIGAPFSDHVGTPREVDVVVLEVSSFQLDHIDTFRPRVAVLLNITPDHLDRYGNDFMAYARAKFRIFENQREDDVLVYNYDDELVREHVSEGARERRLKTVGFSLEQELDGGAFIRRSRDRAGADEIVLRIEGEEEVLMRTDEPSLLGRHNLYNSLAAAVAARVLEVRSDVLRESLASFEGVPHRLELVRELDGVRYVNDSKATNVNAVWYALETFNNRIVLIAGGRDKGNDYEDIKPLVQEKVAVLVAIGESAEKVTQELGARVPTVRQAATMAEAVDLARELARSGDVVLLSPACASFDMYDDYEHRGDDFKNLVNEL